MKIKILLSAYNDLKNGRKFYEKQGEGLGDYFFDSLFSDIDSLLIYGGIHQKAGDYYRLLSNRFPYAIYYKMNKGEKITVYRILDCRQNPEKTHKSLN
ncbi:hypothetical protein LZ24_03487 [Desulfobotulus alkaliphilus]|uniref:ParE-like toxin of type II ParDE toxin-antitoxin system n=1 Tax=Desulfobotulus alkaliphilus TaxID=622671 RepID=A0A562QWM1_9BACT|nr:type II toxin-antitoxin system RelE/ParE family toxin [Desulfobotulus alkaliphilus]TWI60536.1 hypothetical protein LZ24_03487 [Desulfobotulus alkaliphilus]